MKIAVIEDSKKIGYIIFKAFQQESITVETFESIADARRIKPDIYAAYIVDYNLGDGSGTDFIKQVRGRGEQTPILMLTVRGDLEDKLECFKLGADDYMTKPFELAELVARIKGLVSRSYEKSEKKIEVEGITYDVESGELVFQEKKLRFSQKEYQILTYLLRNRGRVIDKDKIIESIWIDSEEKDPNIVNVYVNRIREKLKKEKAPMIIQTIRGFGYTIE